MFVFIIFNVFLLSGPKVVSPDIATFILQFGVSLTATPAITFSQATTVAGGSAKTLGFTQVGLNAATGTNDTLVATAVTSNTIDKAATSQQMFTVEFDAAQLDVTNG